MKPITKSRIASIDMLKGLVMVVMALDHVREYFHYSAFMFDPGDPLQSNLPVFFTRWITHFCAPSFSFLAGLSAYMAGKQKTKKELSGFLIKRGLWLIFIDMTIVNFGWYFDPTFSTINFLVIASLGFSMIVLAALIHLKPVYILLFSLLLIGCHNLLDNVHFPGSIGWSLLHEQQFFQLTKHLQLLIGYPVIPWMAVMSLGYYFGNFYLADVNVAMRRKLFNTIGATAIMLFLILRYAGFYGDKNPFVPYENATQSIISFFNPSKYPPSLLYLLMTLGVVFLTLANIENLKGRLVNFFSTFGRVPFFYYILHIYIIHLFALLFAQLSGWGWQKLILSTWIGFAPNMQGYGFSLRMVYAIWMGLILLLYPVCKWFDKYKKANKQKWWLSYL